MPEIRKIQISISIQSSAAAGFSAGWLKISATSQRLQISYSCQTRGILGLLHA
jgi:hypothetical protein